MKAVNPSINVIGIAVSPKGDYWPGSARNTISPVRFIKAVGDAYRETGRKKPIMDNVALHPYPFVNTDPPDKGAPWPQVSVANLDRAEQAFWDGFNGTAQPTFEEAGVQRVQSRRSGPWVLDEAGWQTDTRGLPGYTGTRTRRRSTRRHRRRITRRSSSGTRATTHVGALLFFHWIDEADRDRLQSGLMRANRAMKPAANAARDSVQAGCCGGPALGSIDQGRRRELHVEAEERQPLRGEGVRGRDVRGDRDADEAGARAGHAPAQEAQHRG